ncbi:phosphoenolpyruvate--protein phosphotransferase [Sneathiella limimaris]|uniref:phosphoenolpyruvate--protein phosphotransferase n=1 Tax=Sneathiella limimaris TaxID=1964213 RepID=UPI00146AC06B|nr:phosphoenolpyruvate--protein phosphotransferase [Sneathiella limimaris]
MSSAALSGPRILFRQIREVMAGKGDPERRLQRIVQLIASNMIAEVCSCYLMRAGEMLELFATEGLKQEAVHNTRLRVGEGLVGDIAAHARPLNLPDAQAHPQFAYRPETGEEVFHSLLGVPIKRGGRVIGVLVVQNRTMRHYTEEEAEALQTIAMVVAELISSEEIIASTELLDTAGNATKPHRLTGRPLADGLGIGTALLHEPHIVVRRTIAENIGEELDRLKVAISRLQEGIDEMLSSSDTLITGESRDIFEAYKMFAHDKSWLRKLEGAVDSGLTAEAAIKRVQDETRSRMKQITDPYIRERLSDLDDLANRLYLQLENGDGIDRQHLTEDTVVIARNMGAAELLDYDRVHLQAVVLVEGTRSSHVAIVARALGIPILGQCREIYNTVEEGDLVLVDGENGQAFLRPSDDVIQIFKKSMRHRAERQAKYAALRSEEAVTKDAEKVSLNMNAGLLIDLENFQDSGAEGIGLFRTELQFMVRSQMPKVDEQTELYAKVLDRMEDNPVIFRTLDVGGDKALPYLEMKEEENPALGWRAIRIGLDRPALLKAQLRAMVRASVGRNLSLMFPMIAEVAEFLEAKSLLMKEIEKEEARSGQRPRKVEVGTMIEVPSIVWQLPQLLKVVDFVSVGSNDLMQFYFAVDRGNSRVTDRYDMLSPGFMSVMKFIADECRKAGVPVSVCGDVAGKPLEAMTLIGLGYRSLSMSIEGLGPVKEMVRSMDTAKIRDFVNSLCIVNEHSVRPQLKAFAKDHAVII